MCENEPDSEDDFEGYFLKPVNGYNIVDRIKDANEELFATPQPPSPSVLHRKVTFRTNLEDYEPNSEDISSIIALIEPILHNPEESDSAISLEQEVVTRNSENYQKETMSDSSDHEIEEICEEVDSLEVQDPLSDCERSLSSEIEPELKKKIEVKCTIRPTSETEETVEDLLTSISQSSDDSPPLIQASAVEDEQRVLEKRLLDQISESQQDKQNCPRTPREKRSKQQTKQQYGSDILKLRLNYKTCCEYKNSIDNLPRYSGYFSQYGLSKDQWERREKRYESKRRRFEEKSHKAAEAESKKIEDNERAFTNWLRNKMRYPINKTKNMFDFKPIKLKRRKKGNEINN